MPPILIRLAPPSKPPGSTSVVARVLQTAALVVATSAAVVLTLVLAALAATAMLAIFLLHKLGWDRRLAGYVLKKQGFRIETQADVTPSESPAPADAPIDVAWTVVEERRPG